MRVPGLVLAAKPTCTFDILISEYNMKKSMLVSSVYVINVRY